MPEHLMEITLHHVGPLLEGVWTLPAASCQSNIAIASLLGSANYENKKQTHFLNVQNVTIRPLHL